MKCEYCGGNLSLEAENCPFCGKVNEQAKKHAGAMKRYHRAFEQTRREVEAEANRHTGLMVRVILIAVLLVVAVLLLVLGGKAYEFRRMWIQGQSERNASEYMEILDGYLKEEDFMAFSHFCNEKYIDTYDSVFEKYAPVERAAQNYCYVYQDMMRLVCPPSYQDREDILEALSETLDYFYHTLDMEQYEYYEGADNPLNREALESMEGKVELMLQFYCGLKGEEAEGFKEQTKAKRAIMLEEAVGYEE